MSNTVKEFSPLEKGLAWSVHIFTATGILSAFMALLAVERGDWKMAMVWLIVCQFIDGSKNV